MSPVYLDGGEDLVRFPRASGDEPAARALMALALVFSPRERG